MSENFKSGFVAFVGRPNAGKSTLLNQMVGQKVAIMSDKPQTTRNKILGVLTNEDAQVIFLDTPGIHKPKDRLGDKMNEAAITSLREVDIICYLVDATMEFGGGEAYIIEKLAGVKTPVFLLLNKVDLLENKDALLPLMDLYQAKYQFTEIIPISALKGQNTDALMKILKKYLPDGPQFYPDDTVTDQPERMIIAELIREKVLLNTREEIPHTIAVDVEMIQERNNGTVYVGATIVTERDSQKGILIGKQGTMLKKIGQEARKDIENLLGSKIFLELWVKVKKDWRNRMNLIREFGYGSQE